MDYDNDCTTTLDLRTHRHCLFFSTRLIPFHLTSQTFAIWIIIWVEVRRIVERFCWIRYVEFWLAIDHIWAMYRMNRHRGCPKTRPQRFIDINKRAQQSHIKHIKHTGTYSRTECGILLYIEKKKIHPEHIVHASLFSSEHISTASSNSRFRCLCSAAAKSGSSAAALIVLWSSETSSASGGVMGARDGDGGSEGAEELLLLLVSSKTSVADSADGDGVGITACVFFKKLWSTVNWIA